MYSEQLGILASRADENDKQRIVDQLNTMMAYTNRIRVEDNMFKMAQARYEGPDLQDEFNKLNEQRNRLHDNACEACDALNNISKELRGRPLFSEFTLIPANDPTHMVKYNADNHHDVSLIVAQITNELYCDYSIPVNEFTMDGVAAFGEQGTQLPLLTVESFDDRIEAYNEMMEDQEDIQDVLSESDKDIEVIECHDGTRVKVGIGHSDALACDRNEDGEVVSADIKVEMARNDKVSLGNLILFPNKDNVYRDIPVSFIDEFLQCHGGVEDCYGENSIDKISSIEQALDDAEQTRNMDVKNVSKEEVAIAR